MQMLITNVNNWKLQVFSMYITGHLNTVFPEEHRREILRYIYYHQVHTLELLIIILYNQVN